MLQNPLKKTVFLMTGMSGSGRTIALKTLEDMGYETIDNLPLAFLEPVALAHHNVSQPLAVSVDVRTRDFSLTHFVQELEKLTQDPTIEAKLIFFECDDEVLARRYNASRRLHPLAHDRPVLEGIRLERHVMSPLREYADLVIDTSHWTVADAKGYLRKHFLPQTAPGLSVQIMSFSFQHGLPREADMVFDARLLRNPFYVEEMQHLTGEDPSVDAYVREDPVYGTFMEALRTLIAASLPRFEEEGRQYVTIAVGCTGGQHRSVCVVKALTNWLQKMKKHVKLKHRDLKKIKRI